MFTPKSTTSMAAAIFLMTALLFGRISVSTQAASKIPDVGSAANRMQVAGWNIDVTPDGANLPPGSGTAVEGSKLFALQCAYCHGTHGQGQKVPGRGTFPRLVGGFSTLSSDKPIKTVGSFWPYSTGVFDYIRRAMPLSNPGSLSDHEVYALTAFILSKKKLWTDLTPLDAKTLREIRMPNAHGFFDSQKLGTSTKAPATK
jgi:mono/diheme cytochrome c family protein